MPRKSLKAELLKKLTQWGSDGFIPYWNEKYTNDLEKQYTGKALPYWMKANASTWSSRKRT